MKKTNLLIIEDSRVFAKGLSMLLSPLKAIDSIFIALNYEDAMQCLKSENISIAILDLHFRVATYDGFTIAEKLSVNFPFVKIMILSDYVQTDYYYRLFENTSVKAYIDKQCDESELFEGVRSLMNNEIYLCASIEKLKEIEKWMILTKREKEVVKLLVKGFTQSKISRILFIAEKTVGRHVMNLLRKFEVKNTAELVAKYVAYKNSNDEDVDSCTPPFQQI
ncbi:response regulator transcription factor [uncultured Kordia sp.]|uniref:response regulator transcription factor n=1 Tax=uncultured Kordia sp. TaxID=507699 RepID=UPI002602A37C|nr:response regulator transcription factor [uncultured Kordia sp.]